MWRLIPGHSETGIRKLEVLDMIKLHNKTLSFKMFIHIDTVQVFISCAYTFSFPSYLFLIFLPIQLMT